MKIEAVIQIIKAMVEWAVGIHRIDIHTDEVIN